MQYAKELTKSNKEKSFMSADLLQGRDEECQLKNTCKNLAAGDRIFLLTFNLLYMLCARVCLFAPIPARSFSPTLFFFQRRTRFEFSFVPSG
jgi:hypothetical protein